VPEPITQSRAFCEKLIDLNRTYTRQDIDNISQRVDRDVWKYRGGWYTNPETKATTPYCRHEWVQQIAIKRPSIEIPEEKVNQITIETVKTQTVKNIIKDLGMNEKEFVFEYKELDQIQGSVSWKIQKDGTYSMAKKVTIDNTLTAEEMATTLRHEIRHIYQSEKLGFFIKGENMYWQNEPFISIKNYQKIINGMNRAKTAEKFNKFVKEYNDLPWEKDAVQYEKKMIFSKQNFQERIKLIDKILLPKELIIEEDELPFIR
jgi:hypothetical protein